MHPPSPFPRRSDSATFDRVRAADLAPRALLPTNPSRSRASLKQIYHVCTQKGKRRETCVLPAATAPSPAHAPVKLRKRRFMRDPQKISPPPNPDSPLPTNTDRLHRRRRQGLQAPHHQRALEESDPPRPVHEPAVLSRGGGRRRLGSYKQGGSGTVTTTVSLPSRKTRFPVEQQHRGRTRRGEAEEAEERGGGWE